MKKFLCVIMVYLLVFSLACSLSAYAETPKCQDLTVVLDLTETEHLIPQAVRLNLTTQSGEIFNAQADIVSGMHEAILVFPVGEYDAGETFTLSLVEGVETLKYYDSVYSANENIELVTYAYTADDGSLHMGDTFHLSADPYSNPPVRLDAVHLNLKLTQTTDLQTQTVRFNLFNENGDFLYNTYATVKSGMKEVNLTFPVGPFDAGQKFKLCLTEGAKSVQYYDDEYIPGEPIDLATYTYGLEDGSLFLGDTFHMSLAPLTAADAFKARAEQFVNQKGYTSKTDYLIWVSKSDYRVALFKKSENGWVYRDSFKCTIGAPNSPTVTGQFEYYQYQPKWYYADFWCGPIMRFYGGYALHSTLIRYDGTNYDPRLGVMASHGCVRLAPDAINYLVKVTPLHTAVVVTP